MPADAPLLEVHAIRKSFPGVVALADVSFDVLPGEVHALVGENGAGKSTLLAIMNGLQAPDSGEIRREGRPIQLRNPSVARANRLALVHQELVLCPNLTVAENILLGQEPKSRFGRSDRKAMHQAARRILETIHVDLDPARLTGELSLNEQQIVEICRALASNPEVLVFDEPTASLNDDQVGHLLAIIRKLRAKGLGIVYVSHRLSEVLDIADRITVLRDGRVIETLEAQQASEARLIKLMVGRDQVPSQIAHAPRQLGDVMLEAKSIGAAGLFDDVSLAIRSGEILGIAGLLGCQREAVVRALFGSQPITRGEICVQQRPRKFRSPGEAIKAGLGFLPADRKREGLVLPMSVGDNIALTLLSRLASFGFMRSRRRNRLAQDLIRTLAAKVSGPAQPAVELSGGNQQKIVIAKWIARGGDIFLIEDPTRGVDVGAKPQIWRAVHELAGKGKAILLVTSELQELMDVSDRIIVMSRGRVTGHFTRPEFSVESIARCAVQ
jgi:ribose transport system ATP-binding protein